jgi:hypothetical protein
LEATTLEIVAAMIKLLPRDRITIHALEDPLQYGLILVAFSGGVSRGHERSGVSG